MENDNKYVPGKVDGEDVTLNSEEGQSDVPESSDVAEVTDTPAVSANADTIQPEADEPAQFDRNEPFLEQATLNSDRREDGGSTVRFDTVSVPVEHSSNTGIKVFFSIIAVVVALIIAISCGYVFGTKQDGHHGFTASTAVADKQQSEYQSDKTAVFNDVNPSVVGISVYSGTKLSSYASGIIYTTDGYIVTNDHVYSETSSPKFLVTLYDGTTYDAEFVAGDTRSDLAVLKIEADNLKKATFGNYEQVTVGEEVIAIGYPLGISSKSVLTSGTVSSVGVRFSSTTNYSMKMIQTDAPINPGNSGGALVNMYSQVIGIPSVKLLSTTYDNVGYAIPSSTVVKVVDSLIKYGYVEGRGRLGITYTEVNTITSKVNNIPTGLMVATITTDSDLNGKGINQGDIITHINDTKITTSSVALDIIESTAPGVVMSFTVYHTDTKTSETVYASLLPDQGNSSYTDKVTDDQSSNSFNSNENDDFFSDH